MGENEWLNGYLEAILDVGAGRRRAIEESSDGSNKKKSSFLRKRFDDKVKEEKNFSPTKYFVEEVINSFDEADLHKTWLKVCCLPAPLQTCTNY